jgi:dTDP-4-dehydrorhamnose 3,5-epimerase
MTFRELAIRGVVLVEPRVFGDERGFFLETYHRERYVAGGIEPEFVQDNHSRSVGPILRGLHAQLRRPQGKLVRCVEGSIWDVAVDARPESSTFGRWVAEELSAANHRQLYLPPGMLHAFCVLTGPAQVEYKCTAPYDPQDEIGVIWNDADLGIAWPIEAPVLSAKDAALPPFAELRNRLRAGPSDTAAAVPAHRP